MNTGLRRTLKIRGRPLLPIVLGGMGIGISAHKLAGAVAKLGAVGTIASVELRHLHPDLLERSKKGCNNRVIVEANKEALARELKMARSICGPKGYLAVNVMQALIEWPGLVQQACESGADAIVAGAGLPLDLPELTAKYPDVALIPILSNARGVRIVLMKWWKNFKRRPDAIVIEHPGWAGGHLGAPDLGSVSDPVYDFTTVMPKIFAVFSELGIGRADIPLILAGGINSPERVREMLALGAAGVQVGTPFAVTEEGDAHPNFKRVLLEATTKSIRVFMSTASLPARGVLTPWLTRYLAQETAIRKADLKRGGCPRLVQCLSHCGVCQTGPAPAGRFCIELVLARALHGDVERGLFFRGGASLPFKEVVPVERLVRYLLGLPDAPVPAESY